MIQETVAILSNRPMGADYRKIALACDAVYGKALPGQFVMVKLPERPLPLLRRPFSIHRIITEKDRVLGIELLYKVVGPTTQALAQLHTGDPLDLLGPMGNPFHLPPKAQRIYLAAGGIGVAPLLFLSSFLIRQGVSEKYITLFLGGRRRSDLLCKAEFGRQGIRVHITTDDGSEGDACLLTDPLEAAVRRQPPDIIYACGPMGMLKCVAGIAQTHKVACQLSIETLMACGVGACLSCAVPHRRDASQYLHACTDGPVFDAQILSLDFP